jgi:hypothetical protein
MIGDRAKGVTGIFNKADPPLACSGNGGFPSALSAGHRNCTALTFEEQETGDEGRNT